MGAQIVRQLPKWGILLKSQKKNQMSFCFMAVITACARELTCSLRYMLLMWALTVFPLMNSFVEMVE